MGGEHAERTTEFRQSCSAAWLVAVGTLAAYGRATVPEEQARADGQRRTLEGPDGVRRATSRLDGERLDGERPAVPAVVEEAPHAWTLPDPRSGEPAERAGRAARFACETDPPEHRTGPARWSMGV